MADDTVMQAHIEGLRAEVKRLTAKNERMRSALVWIEDRAVLAAEETLARRMAQEARKALVALEQVAQDSTPPDGWMADGSWAPGG